MANWANIGNQVLWLLESIRQQETAVAVEAAQRGITLNQLTAAMITSMVREAVEKVERPRGRPSRFKR
jgi:hypothetical protein